jgi:hypothetical protein
MCVRGYQQDMRRIRTSLYALVGWAALRLVRARARRAVARRVGR